MVLMASPEVPVSLAYRALTEFGEREENRVNKVFLDYKDIKVLSVTLGMMGSRVETVIEEGAVWRELKVSVVTMEMRDLLDRTGLQEWTVDRVTQDLKGRWDYQGSLVPREGKVTQEMRETSDLWGLKE